MLALPAWIILTGMPIFSMISMPYWKENTMPSWAARIRCALPWRLKFTPWMLQPVSLFPSMRSAPLPKGRMDTPSEPMGTEAATSFMSA